METTVKIIADTINDGNRLTSFELVYPRIIHSEVMTYRMFARNASSSRAIPTEKLIESVDKDGFIPSYFGKNCKGMSPKEELDKGKLDEALMYWNRAKNKAVLYATDLLEAGVHKQLANRILEPYSYISVILTANESSLQHLFKQRISDSAQYEIKELASLMKNKLDNSIPLEHNVHVPYYKEILENEYANTVVEHERIPTIYIISIAKCASISYLRQNENKKLEDYIRIYTNLTSNGHLSPLEHVALYYTNMQSKIKPNGCLAPYYSFRNIYEVPELYNYYFPDYV